MKTSIHLSFLLLFFCASLSPSPAIANRSITTTASVYCDPPGGLHVTNISETTATLQWYDVYGANSYTVQIRSGYGQWYDVPGGPFTYEWVTIHGLTPNTTYEWRVRSNCSYYEHSAWSYGNPFITDGSYGYCEAPDGLITQNITQTSATFDWDPVPGAHSYTIQWRYPNGAWHYLVKSWPHSWVNVGGLDPGTTYEWRVRANCSYGEHSNWSESAVFTTLGGYSCHAPEDLHASYITESSATLSWDAVPGAQSYSVQIRTPYGNWQYVDGSPFYNEYAEVWGLDPGTTYEWRVRANCGYGSKSYWSYPSYFTTDGTYTECHAPEGLNTYNITHSSATWDWSPVSGAHSYSVQWRYPNGNWNTLYGGPWSASHLNVWGLQPGTTYEWRVRANCAYGYYSDWSYPAVFTTLGSQCQKPTNLITTEITDTTARLTWNSAVGAQNYSVQIRLPNGNWMTVPGSPFIDTTVVVTNLSPGTPYYWRVRSNCGTGYKAYWTSPASFTTTGMSSCTAPDSVYTTNVTETHATLNWTPAGGALSYTIQWREAPNGVWFTLPTGPWPYTHLNISGLDANTTYEWRVRSNCANQLVSPYSDVASFTTEGSGGSGAPNDFCSHATTLQVDSICNAVTASNIDATSSNPPPQGGCASGSYRDVWFKFTMPNEAYPEVTIRTTAGSLADAAMEVYIGNNCNNLSYLVCENDNTNGNGSAMPVVNIVGGPGITVYIRVWGNQGATGTFDICVLDHHTVDVGEDVERIVLDVDGTIQVGADPVRETVAPAISTPEVVGDSDFGELKVSPNPATDLLDINYLMQENESVTGIVLVDMSGKVVLERRYQPDTDIDFQEQINVSNYAPGLYLLHLKTTHGILSEKIMVVR